MEQKRYQWIMITFNSFQDASGRILNCHKALFFFTFNSFQDASSRGEEAGGKGQSFQFLLGCFSVNPLWSPEGNRYSGAFNSFQDASSYGLHLSIPNIPYFQFLLGCFVGVRAPQDAGLPLLSIPSRMLPSRGLKCLQPRFSFNSFQDASVF